jgi:hypothetical protein
MTLDVSSKLLLYLIYLPKKQPSIHILADHDEERQLSYIHEVIILLLPRKFDELLSVIIPVYMIYHKNNHPPSIDNTTVLTIIV